MKRKKRYIILFLSITVIVVFFILAFLNYSFFYIRPDTSTIDLSILYTEDNVYEYPSDAVKVASKNGYYQYPLITIDEFDNSKYQLVHNGAVSYTIDDTEFLKEHKMDLVVYQRGTTHCEYNSTFALYKDGECIDYVVCTTFIESFRFRTSTSEFWFIAEYLLNH